MYGKNTSTSEDSTWDSGALVGYMTFADHMLRSAAGSPFHPRRAPSAPGDRQDYSAYGDSNVYQTPGDRGQNCPGSSCPGSGSAQSRRPATAGAAAGARGGERGAQRGRQPSYAYMEFSPPAYRGALQHQMPPVGNRQGFTAGASHSVWREQGGYHDAPRSFVEQEVARHPCSTAPVVAPLPARRPPSPQSPYLESIGFRPPNEVLDDDTYRNRRIVRRLFTDESDDEYSSTQDPVDDAWYETEPRAPSPECYCPAENRDVSWPSY